MPCGLPTASGSTLGSAIMISRVATFLTQSPEPGSGTSSTSIPSALNQPIRAAMAKGVEAPEMVREHQPTVTFVVCAAAGPTAQARSAYSVTAAAIALMD